MRCRTGWSILAFLVVGTSTAAAQPPAPPTPRAPRAPPAIRAQEARRAALLEVAERALLLRERLQLTDDQVNRLESLRQEEVGRRLELQREREELRSRQRAGYEDAALRERLEALRAAERAAAGDRRTELDAILTDAQREQLMSRRVRAVAPRLRSEPGRSDLRIRPAPRPPRSRQEARPAPRIRPEAPAAPRIRPEVPTAPRLRPEAPSAPRLRPESRSVPRMRSESRSLPRVRLRRSGGGAVPLLRSALPSVELRRPLPSAVRIR